MRILFILLAISLIQTGCEDRKKSTGEAQPAVAKENSSGDNDAQSQQQADLDVEDDSVAVLEEHVEDLDAFLKASRGGESGPAKYPELANHANTLLTHYHFEVFPPLRRGGYRDAAYAWDLGELYATRLLETYEQSSEAQQELGELWQNFQKSRELMLYLKAEWNKL